MGCGKSKGGIGVQERNVQDASGKQERLRDAWMIVEKNLDHHGVEWFLKLFHKLPQTLELFHFKNETDLKNSKWLRLHAAMSWRVIGRVVKNADDAEIALAEVRSIAKAHRKLELSQEVFATASIIFLEVLEEVLGPSVWDDELKKGYEQVFAMITREMLSQTQCAARAPSLPLEESKREQIIQECWELVEQDMESNGMKLILRVIDIAPDALFHLPFQASSSSEAAGKEELYSNEMDISKDNTLRGHGRLMLKTFGRAIHNHKTLSVLEAELMAVGRTHAQFQMRSDLFKKVGDALVWLLKTDVARNRWDHDHDKAWDTVVSFVVATMSKGMAT